MNRVFSGRALLAAKSTLNGSSLIVRTLKSDLKIKWKRPEKVSCFDPSKTGDRASMPKVDENNVAVDFQTATELENADPDVKKLFQLKFQPGKATNKFHQQEVLSGTRRHEMDTESWEAKVARMTAHIRYLQEHIKNTPRNGQTNKTLKEMIEKRKKYLSILRSEDYKCYEWILEKLDLEYKPQPHTFIMIARKEGLRQLTRIHCEDVRKSRLEEYKDELQAQQLPFLEDKLKNLEFIRNEQLDLGIEVTVSQQEIDGVRQQYEELKAKRTTESDGDDSGKKWKMY